MLECEFNQIIEMVNDLWPRMTINPGHKRFWWDWFNKYSYQKVAEAIRAYYEIRPDSTRPEWQYIRNKLGDISTHHYSFQEKRLMDLRELYAGWRGWECPTNSELMEYIINEKLTPLEEHVKDECKKLSTRYKNAVKTVNETLEIKEVQQ